MTSLDVEGSLAAFTDSRLLQQAGGGAEKPLGGFPRTHVRHPHDRVAGALSQQIDIFVGIVGWQPIDRAEAFDQTLQRGTVGAALPVRVAFIRLEARAIDRLVGIVRQAPGAKQPVC